VPVTLGDRRFGVIQAVNVARRYLAPDAPPALEEIGLLFGAALASAQRRNELDDTGRDHRAGETSPSI